MIQGMCQCSDWWQIHQHVDGQLVTLDEDDDLGPIAELDVSLPPLGRVVGRRRVKPPRSATP